MKDAALNKLTAWKGNVRKTGAKDGISELASSIATHSPVINRVVPAGGGARSSRWRSRLH
jgi:hypothetical protein